MKSWKEHANLFANGKFQVKMDDRDDFILQGLFHSYDTNTGYIYIDGTETELDENCTLIARPISDLSDEEALIWDNSFTMDQEVEAFLYLLTIGVLPRQFEHQFESGEVIARYENK